MRKLSIFIDESGDYGFQKGSSDYYLITLVFHNQNDNIHPILDNFQKQLDYIKPHIHTIHTGPIIKKKDEYKYLSIDERRSIMYSTLNFIRKCPIT